MYELDSEDWCLCVYRNGLPDAVVWVSQVGLIWSSRGVSDIWTHDAYAPLPMVLETTLKGRSEGRGLS